MTESEANAERHPKLFISYSWTSADHVEWVLRLGTDLRTNGVDAILDQWHLKEGQDAHSFMEQMVRDEKIERVALVCDNKYVDRANKRTGGVGVESQIITNKIYGDVEQTKFVALALASSEGGSALLPNFVSSRIYIDFRDEDKYAESFEQLLRWVFDKPLHVAPELGRRPAFIDEQVQISPTSLRPMALGRSSGDSKSQFTVLWRDAVKRHSDFTLELANSDDADQAVVDAIGAMPPLISQLIVSVRDALETGEFRDAHVDQLRNFFETCLANYKKGSTNWGADATKFFTEFMFVSVTALFLRFRDFRALERFLGEPFIEMLHDNVTAREMPFSNINTDIQSLEHRNLRLKSNRASLRADFIKETANNVPIEFGEYLQADFFLFMYCDRRVEGEIWWPDSNIYSSGRSGAYPIFVRAQRSDMRDRVLSVLDLNSKVKLEKLAADLRTERYARFRWRSAFSNLAIGSLMNIDALLASYS